VAPEPKPGTLTPEEREARAAAAFAAMNASHIRVDTTRHPGMHKSRTTDYIILLKGRVRLLLDDEERDLEPFDVVVQRGTNHAWVNLDDEPALLVAVLLDASDDAGQP
jgi:quercetin dioxygenase-like cupin family protein